MVEGVGLELIGDHVKNAQGTIKTYRCTGKAVVNKLRNNFALYDLLLWLNRGFQSTVAITKATNTN